MSDFTPDWDALARLRSRFLEQGSGAGVYWRDENDLAQYHAFFAARIGWKWDSFLDELTRRGVGPQSKRLLDWGCGSGIATLRALDAWGSERFESILLWDHSTLACRFAQKEIQAQYPDLEVEIAGGPDSWGPLQDTTVLVSHALNELTDEAQNALTRQLADADHLLFVEAGDYKTSRLLVRQREALREHFDIVAPCTQSDRCPMLRQDNARHWCHFFAKPPLEAFTEGDWARFGQLMEIDLRSLPYSCLALSNKRLASTADLPPSASRIIGRPRQFKGYTRVLSCDSAGLQDLELQKRDDKALWKSLKKGKDGSLYRWTSIAANRIQSGTPLL